MKILIFLFILATITSCQIKESTQNEESFVNHNIDTLTLSDQFNEIDLKYIETIKISLDSITLFNNSRFDLYKNEIDNKYYLNVFNTFTGYFSQYDFYENKLIKRVRINEQGPDGIGSFNFVAFRQINSDSLIFISKESFRVSFLDSDLNILSKAQLPGGADAGYAYAYQLNYHNLFEWYNNRLHLNVRDAYAYMQVKPSFSAISFNPTDGSFSPLIDAPKIISEYFFGAEANILSYSSALDKENNTFFHSYGVIPEIYIQKDSSLSTFEFTTSDGPDPKPMTTFDEILNFEYKDIQNFALTNSRFLQVTYDPFRKILIRHYDYPRSEANLSLGLPRKTAFIFARPNGEILGQSIIPNNVYTPALIYFTEKGLILHNEKKYNTEDENHFHFDVFEYVSKPLQ